MQFHELLGLQVAQVAKAKSSSVARVEGSRALGAANLEFGGEEPL